MRPWLRLRHPLAQRAEWRAKAQGPMATFRVGTSGWSYASWRGRFYPAELSPRRYLEFYARHFSTTEVNYSFYHLPRPSTYEKWCVQVPDDFCFALKVSRFITHVKRLHRVQEAWELFVSNARSLGRRLGPLLLQFPASFHCDIARLTAFLHDARPRACRSPLRLALEFRHPSWFTEETFEILRAHDAALCIADAPQYPRCNVITASFVYLRFHGRQQLFASKYTDAELTAEATRIRRWLRDGLDVYVYFNNDASAHAVANAQTLARLVQRKIRR